MSINVQLLQRELDFLLEHPERHLQVAYFDFPLSVARRGPNWRAETTEWHCQTVGCLAGWTAMHQGWVPALHPADSYSDALSFDTPTVWNPKTGAQLSAFDAAQALLGLSSQQATALFSATNSLLGMYDWAYRFTGGQIQVPPRAWFDEYGRALPKSQRPVGPDIVGLEQEGLAWDEAARVAAQTPTQRNNEPVALVR